MMSVLNVVCRRRNATAAARPVGVEELAARFVNAFIGVRAEVIALCLQQIRGKAGSAETVVERERRRERWSRHAVFDCADHAAAPALLILVQKVTEESIEKQVVEFGILVEGILDLAQE